MPILDRLASLVGRKKAPPEQAVEEISPAAITVQPLSVAYPRNEGASVTERIAGAWEVQNDVAFRSRYGQSTEGFHFSLEAQPLAITEASAEPQWSRPYATADMAREAYRAAEQGLLDRPAEFERLDRFARDADQGETSVANARDIWAYNQAAILNDAVLSAEDMQDKINDLGDPPPSVMTPFRIGIEGLEIVQDTPEAVQMWRSAADEILASPSPTFSETMDRLAEVSLLRHVPVIQVESTRALWEREVLEISGSTLPEREKEMLIESLGPAESWGEVSNDLAYDRYAREQSRDANDLDAADLAEAYADVAGDATLADRLDYEEPRDILRSVRESVHREAKEHTKEKEESLEMEMDL